MAKYVTKRVLLAIVTVFIVCGITFFSMNAIPGGPFDGEKALSPEVKAALEKRFNLDKPVPEQFALYLKNLSHGDFGVSAKTGRDIKTTIFESFKVSAKLGGMAIITALIFGLIFGSIAALTRNKLPDRLIIFFSTLFTSLPSFVFASLLLLVFCVTLKWIPVWDPNNPNYLLPVIALSARDDMHEKEYQEAGFSAYLNKPYTPEQLYSRVNDLLGCAIETKQPTTQTSDKNAPYNLDMIMVFADNDKDAANQIIGSFISDCKTNFQLLAQHLESHETEQIAKLAHKMLPMFKQLAINDVIPSLLFLEKMPLDTEENKIRESIEKILQEGNNVLQLLEKETRQ